MTKRILAVAIVLVAVCLLAALTTSLKAKPIQDNEKEKPTLRTDVPPPAQSAGGLIFFTDQDDFEAYVQGDGKDLQGIEDFEESTLSPGAFDVFNDSLESGVPNLPDGFPFPDGLTGLPNLIVQSNVLGGNPINPMPRGVDGLAALSDGFAGAVSDVAVANSSVDSFDLIFTGETTGVGFNPFAFVSTVEVRVYSTTNEFRGMITTPADASGTNFIGVWSHMPIGRINIFGLGNGTEGGDNIQAWGVGVPCPWDLHGDGNVALGDLRILLGWWGFDPNGPPDFDGDGNVSTIDLLILFANWGPCL